jgi:hypothetical protein
MAFPRVPSGAEWAITRIATFSAALLLLSGMVLSGCAYHPDAAQRAEAPSQRDIPAPGTVVVHMNVSVTSEATLAH